MAVGCAGTNKPCLLSFAISMRQMETRLGGIGIVTPSGLVLSRSSKSPFSKRS